MERLHKSRPQHLKNSRKRLPVSTYLGYLLIFTLVLTGASFARFATTSSDSDGARIAAFIVDAAGNKNETLAIDCGTGKNTAEYTLTVKNNDASGKASEVAISYDVVLTLPKALPKGLTVTLDGKNGTVSDKNITFANAGNFTAATGATNPHTLKVTADPAIVMDEIILNTISVEVIAEQIH